MAEKVVLTKAGKEELEKELRELIDNTREEVKRQLAEARAQGDLSENEDEAQLPVHIKGIFYDTERDGGTCHQGLREDT